MTGYPNDQSKVSAAIPVYTAAAPTPTYRCQIIDFLPVATATDILVLNGAAGKKIRINKIQITMDAGAASVLDIYVYRRAALDTNGTSTTPAILSCSSQNVAPSGVVKLYSSNPTINDAGVLAAGDHYMIPANNGAGIFNSPPWVETFGSNGQCVELNSATECLALSLNGQALPAGLSMYIMVEWTEQ